LSKVALQKVGALLLVGLRSTGFSVGVNFPQLAPPAVEHRRPFVWWHIARSDPLREMAGDSLVRPISKQERCAPARKRDSPAFGTRRSQRPTGVAAVAPRGNCRRSSRVTFGSECLFQITPTRARANAQIRCSKLSSLSHLSEAISDSNLLIIQDMCKFQYHNILEILDNLVGGLRSPPAHSLEVHPKGGPRGRTILG
jgi:hypothetical protein